MLTADKVSVRYGGHRALTDVELGVGVGESVGIIGPNGAGKSTLMEVLSGFRKPSSGRVLFEERVLHSGQAYRFAHVGIVRAWQATRLFGQLTVIENLLVSAMGRPDGAKGKVSLARSLGRYSQEDVDEGFAYLERFGLAGRAGAYASELSGGQRRLLEIARTLWLKPAIVLLDEPSVGVSPTMRRVITEVLGEELAARRIGLMVVEHELELIERICTVTNVLIAGQVVARGTLESVLAEDVVRRGYLGVRG